MAIYLDYHSTTPVDPGVLETMLPYFSENFGNAASKIHSFGLTAFEAVESARQQIARLINAESGEIYFTSGATESINIALQGCLEAYPTLRLITWNTEHSAVLDTCRFLKEKKDVRVTVLPVKKDGLIDLNALETELQKGRAVVSVAHANNEIGTVQPVREICALAKSYDSLVHVDCAQSYGKLPVNLPEWDADFLSVSGHKIYAPKGIGVLVVKRRIPPIKVRPLFYGGGQEKSIRPGTLNVPGIVGIGKASEIAMNEMAGEMERIVQLRDLLLQLLRESFPEIIVNGTLAHRLPNNLNVSFPNIKGEMLLPELRDKLAVSSGSACHTKSTEPSHVLKSLGLSDTLAFSGLRFGLGRFTTRDEIFESYEILKYTIVKIKL